MGVFDGAALSIHLDGELKGTRAVAAPIDTTLLPLRIGSDYIAGGAGQKYLNGAMGEVGIWERPLRLSEIMALADRSGPPRVTSHPQPQAQYAGGTATFTVAARGSPVLRYVWYHGDDEIRSATTATLTLLNVQPPDAGQHRCKVSNELGEVFSDPATLTVVTPASLNNGLEAM